MKRFWQNHYNVLDAPAKLETKKQFDEEGNHFSHSCGLFLLQSFRNLFVIVLVHFNSIRNPVLHNYTLINGSNYGANGSLAVKEAAPWSEGHRLKSTKQQGATKAPLSKVPSILHWMG